jgi:hypothetical protein
MCGMKVQEVKSRDEDLYEGATRLALVPRMNGTALEGRICPGCGNPSANGGYCRYCIDAPVGYALDETTKRQAKAAGRLETFAYCAAVCAVMCFFAWEFRFWLCDLVSMWVDRFVWLFSGR